MLTPFLQGGLVTGCLIIGLFFLRFWKQSKDQLFLYFASAFWLLGINWIVLAFTASTEHQPFFYLIRLAAFALIIFGVWQKNRASKPSA